MFDAAGLRKLSKKLGVPTVEVIWEVQRDFGATAVPLFVVVDRSGRVVFTQSGFGDCQVIEDSIHRALVTK